MDVELRADLCVRWRGIAVEQNGRSHDDAAQAVTALTRLLLDEGLLQGVQHCAIPKPFDGCDRSAFRRRYGSVAGLHASPIHRNRAASAHALSASEPGTLQLEIISQDVDKRSARVRYYGPSCTVNSELDGLRQGLNSPGCRILEPYPIVRNCGTCLGARVTRVAWAIAVWNAQVPIVKELPGAAT